MDESIRPRTPMDAFTQALEVISGDAAARAQVLERRRQLDAAKIKRKDDHALKLQIDAHPEQWL